MLFPTEHGAELQSTLSAEIPPGLSRAKSIPSEESAKQLLDSAVAAESSAEVVEVEKGEVCDVRSAVQRMTARQKWHWAYRKTIIKIRVLESGFGFTKTRIAKAESVLQRLERIEQRMFFVPLEARAFTTEIFTKLEDKLRAAIGDVEAVHSDFSKVTVETLQGLDTRIGGLGDDMMTLQADLSVVQKTLADTVSSQSKQLQEDIDRIHRRHDEIAQREQGLLLNKLQDLSRTFASLQQQASTASEDLSNTIASNAKLYKKNADDSISALLQVDTTMRRMRETLRQMEGDVFTVRTIAQNLKNEVSKVGQGNGMAAAVADLERVLSEGLPVITQGIDEAKDKLHSHDQILAERWVSLSGMMKAISNISGLSEKLEKLECEMENKVAMAELQSMSKEMTSVALEEFQQPLDERMEALVASLSEQKGRVEALEAELKELPAKISPTQPSPTKLTPAAEVPTKSPTASIMNAAEVQAVTEVVSQGWNPADMEAQLHPIIKEIVNSYMAEWHGPDEVAAREGQGSERHETSVMNSGARLEMTDDSFTNESAAMFDGTAIAAGGLFQVQTGGENSAAAIYPVSPQASPHVTTTAATIEMNDSLVPSPVDKVMSAITDVSSPEKIVTSDHTSQTRPETSLGVTDISEPEVNEKPTIGFSGKPEDDKKTLTLPPISSSTSSFAAIPVEKARRLQQPSSSGRSSPDGTSPAPTRSSTPKVVNAPTNTGASVDVAEIIKLRNDLKELQDKFVEINRTKIDTESVRALLAQKADMKVVEKKVDTRIVSAIEAAIGDVMTEIGNLRDMQAAEIENVKEVMAKRIKSSLKAVLEETCTSSNGATVSYKGLCMSCGQGSPVRTISGHTNPPNFIPSLNGDSTNGPEVYRSGFRMPTGPTSAPTSLYAATLLDSLSEVEGRPPPSLQVKRPQELKPLMIASASYTEDSASVRNIRRKGFPGKTSQRAVVSVTYGICNWWL